MSQAAAAAIGEARDIAGNLRRQPLLDRAADITPAQSPVADEITPLPDPEESNGPAGVIPVIAPDAPARHAQNDRLFADCDRRKSYSTTLPNGGYLRTGPGPAPVTECDPISGPACCLPAMRAAGDADL
jgi:hypothetical protein